MTGSAILNGFLGGLLIGGGGAVLLLFNGRIAGISGIVDNALHGDIGDRGWRIAFLVGLVVPVAVRGLGSVELPHGWTLIVVSGLLVGLGTRIGSGCTSGHGVCGIANLSRRSLVATLIFIGTAIVTVYLVRHAGRA